MAKVILNLLVVTFLFVASKVDAQDTLTLLTGKTVAIKVDSITKDMIYYQLIKNGKMKPRSMDKESVFSIRSASGEETVFYKKNPEEDYDMTVEEMRYYIYGAQDARKGYKNPWITIISFTVGGAAGFGLYDKPYVAAVPFVIPVIAGSTGTEFNKGSVRNEDFRKIEAYQSGYFKRAKSRKVTNALIGSLLGTGLGVMVGQEAN